MKLRCNDPTREGYQNYGGRGISYTSSWETFTVFYTDMGPCPAGKQLDRIDNNKGYFKENCQWATRSEQSLNRRPRKGGSGYNGVYYYKPRQKWKATITLLGDRITLGSFDTILDAVAARIRAEKAL